MSLDSATRTTAEKIDLFRSFFMGLPHFYGTYDPDSGRTWQEKKPVTEEVILNHLKGRRPYGVYLLMKDTIRAMVADFDHHDPKKPLEFIQTARHFQLPAYLETSKSKGFHVWVFFQKSGVKAFKARLVAAAILDQIDSRTTEIFPKQDLLDSRAVFGNFIYAPLFGRLVPEGKTVFVDPETLEPCKNQWDFIESIKRVDENALDNIIEINNLVHPKNTEKQPDRAANSRTAFTISLPPCFQKILQDGVSRYQRTSCFRLAVQLKRIGLPFDIAIAALITWSLKNKPEEGKQIITDREIIEQATSAYQKPYQSYGCETAEIQPFCQPGCFVKRKATPNRSKAGRSLISDTTGKNISFFSRKYEAL